MGFLGGFDGVGAGELEHLGHVLDIFVAHLLRLFNEVIIAVGQAEATLIEVHDVVFGILRVEAGTGIEETTETVLVEVAEQGGKLSLVFEGFDLLEIGEQLAIATLVDGDGVHASIIEIADLLGDAALDGVDVFGDLVDNVLNQDLVVLVNLGEGTIGGVLFRDGIVLDPVVVGITEEVFRRVDGGVHVAQVDGRNNFFLRLRCFDCLLCAACCHCT
ncbi:MAG: hypothetical protein F083_1542 [bacterium F083]|nr:MAG: hypothetical protein F083_1542 [bacterium F083]